MKSHAQDKRMLCSKVDNNLTNEWNTIFDIFTKNGEYAMCFQKMQNASIYQSLFVLITVFWFNAYQF